MNNTLKALVEYIKDLPVQAKPVNEFTQFLSEMGLGETVVFSLFFLPAFLILWLMIFKLFEVQPQGRKTFTVFLVLAYVASISFLKYEGRSREKITANKNKVNHFMIYRCLLEFECDKVCTALGISLGDLKELESHQPNSFTIMQSQMDNDAFFLTLTDTTIVNLINERLEDFNEVVAIEMEQKDTIRVNNLIEETKHFANLTPKAIQNTVERISNKVRYVSNARGDYLIKP